MKEGSKKWESSYNYYKDQLHKLNGPVSIKFTSDCGDTNYLNLNDVSIQAIGRELQILKDKGQITVSESY